MVHFRWRACVLIQRKCETYYFLVDVSEWKSWFGFFTVPLVHVVGWIQEPDWVVPPSTHACLNVQKNAVNKYSQISRKKITFKWLPVLQTLVNSGMKIRFLPEFRFENSKSWVLNSKKLFRPAASNIGLRPMFRFPNSSPFSYLRWTLTAPWRQLGESPWWRISTDECGDAEFWKGRRITDRERRLETVHSVR